MKTSGFCTLLLLAFGAFTAAQASNPFDVLYQAAGKHKLTENRAPETTMHHPVSLGSAPNPVHSVIYGRRTADGDYVTYCEVKHDHSVLEPIGGGQRPRERR